jgi:hypothetical protein
MYRLYQLVSAIIRKSFNYNGYKKNSRTYEIIGISFEELKIYLESKFEDWMTWNNRKKIGEKEKTGWDVYFLVEPKKAKNAEKLKELLSYKNLYPREI